MNELDALVEDAKQKCDVAKLEYEKAKYLYDTLVTAQKASGNSIKPSEKPDTNKAERKFVDKKTIDLSELGVIESPKPSFISVIEGIVKKLGNQEFVVAHIEKLLIDMGEMPAGKSARAKIAGTLSKIVDKGLIKRTYEGTGNKPNRFILAEFYEEPEEEFKAPPPPKVVRGHIVR